MPTNTAKFRLRLLHRRPDRRYAASACGAGNLRRHQITALRRPGQPRLLEQGAFRPDCEGLRRDGRGVVARPATGDRRREVLHHRRCLPQLETAAHPRQPRHPEYLPNALPGLGEETGRAEIRFAPGWPFPWGSGVHTILWADHRAVWRGPVCPGLVPNGSRPALRQSRHRLVPGAHSL